MIQVTTEACCGYAAALVCIVAFGSFNVPIKFETVRKANVDPLVLQTYKIAAAFVTCWLVLLVGIEFSLSPWGFASGLLMVPGGTAGYYGVQNAGLATAQGISCSLKVIVSFAWGLIVFHEPVRSVGGSIASVSLMIMGLVGMSLFSSRQSERSLQPDDENENRVDNDSSEIESFLGERLSNAHDNDTTPPVTGYRNLEDATMDKTNYEEIIEPGQLDSIPSHDPEATTASRSRRQRFWGIVGAIIDGGYGGSVLVPMHYSARSNENAKGLGYLISFSVGCTIVMCLVWLLRFSVYSIQARSVARGWSDLPSMHFRNVGPYASMAGLIWSLGNVSSIVSVALLGQAYGYSVIQSQLLIAGLWGVFWYREIVDSTDIKRWFLSATATLLGIVYLSQQHVSLDQESTD